MPNHKVPLPSHNLPYPGVASFIGRNDELAKLRQELKHGGRVTISPTSECPGLGKTELALQYAQAFQTDYPGGICWINGSLGWIGEQVIEFAQTHLGLIVPQAAGDGPLSLPQQLDWCWQHWQPEGQVLIILDEVKALADCRQVLLALADRFHIIVTTLQSGLVPRSFSLDLAGLSSAAALMLLPQARDQASPGATAAATALCQELANGPLALKLLAAYWCQQPDLSIIQLQHQLRTALPQTGPGSAAAQSAPTAHQLRLGIRRVFELGWQCLEGEAQTVACLLSLFAPGAIPYDLVEWMVQGLWGETYRLEPAYQQLEALAWVEGIPERGIATFHLHPWLQDCLREKWTQDQVGTVSPGQLEAVFVAVLTGIARQIPQQPTEVALEALAPMVVHIAQVAGQDTQRLTDENLIWPFLGLGRYYQALGLYSLAEPWWQRGLAAVRQRLGEAHPDWAFSLNNLALLYAHWGEAEKAEGLYTQALVLMQRLFGDAHATLAASLSNLASFYATQARWEEAEVLYQQCIERGRQQETPDLDLARGLNNLAEIYRVQGNDSAAERYYQEALTVAQQVVGPEHGTIATCLNNLAELYSAQGRYSEAEALHVRALALRRRLLDNQQGAIATSLNNLAAVYCRQGRFRQAEKRYLQALEVTQQTLGQGHPNYAVSLSNLAVLYAHQNRFAKAEPLLEQALAQQLNQLGALHPDTLRTEQILNQVRAAQGQKNGRVPPRPSKYRS